MDTEEIKFTRKENELLVLLSEKDISKNRKRIETILTAGKLDWAYLLAASFVGKVNNLVFYNLVTSGLYKNVNYSLFRVWYENFYYTKEKLDRMFREMLQLIKRLEERDIPYAVLKGFSLNELVYKVKDGYVRDSGDIDLLVSQNDLSAVCEVLAGMGYVQGDYDFGQACVRKADRVKTIEMRLKTHQLYQFIKILDSSPETGRKDILYIDVNFSIFSGGKIEDPISAEELLGRACRHTTEAGEAFSVLEPHDNMLQLLYHLYRETGYDLKKEQLSDLTLMKFCDIKEYFCRVPLDLKRLAELIIGNHLQKQAYFVFYFTNFIYPGSMDPAFLEQICPNERYHEELRSCASDFESRLFKTDFNVM